MGMGRRAGRFWVAAGAVAALAAGAALHAVAGCAAPATRAAAPGADAGHDVAAVLVTRGRAGSEVVVLDLEAMRIARRVRLRSAAGAIALDCASGMLVTAQCGGVGDDADDAAAIVDPRSGSVRYVTLPRPNPSDVVVAEGSAFVLHGWTDAASPDTMFASVVDPASGRVVRSGPVPQSARLLASGGGRVWLAGPAPGAPGRWPLSSVSPTDLSSRLVTPDGRDVNAVIDAGDALYLLRARQPAREVTSGQVVEAAPDGSVLRAAALQGLRRGAMEGAATAAHLAVIDATGEGRPSRAVAIVERRGLTTSSVVRLDGDPIALAAWRSRFVVLDGERGRLLVIDPAKGVVTGSVNVGDGPLAWGDVVVVPSLRAPVSGP